MTTTHHLLLTLNLNLNPPIMTKKRVVMSI